MAVGTAVTVLGWGRLAAGGDVAVALQELDQNVQDLRDVCQQRWGSPSWGSPNANTFNNNTMFCAASECFVCARALVAPGCVRACLLPHPRALP